MQRGAGRGEIRAQSPLLVLPGNERVPVEESETQSEAQWFPW